MVTLGHSLLKCRINFCLLLFSLSQLTFAQVATLTGFRPDKMAVPRIAVLELDPKIAARMPIAASRFTGTVLTSHGLLTTGPEDTLLALDPESGVEIWRSKFSKNLRGPINSHDDQIYLTLVDGTFLALKLNSGELLWQVALDGFSPRAVTVAGDAIFCVTTGQKLYKIERLTGKISWVYDAGYEDGLAIHSAPPPLVLNNRVIVGLASGSVVAVDAGSGTLAWENQGDYSASRFTDVVGKIHKISNDQIALTSYDGRVESLRVLDSSAARLWQQTFPTITTSESFEGHILLGCYNGDVYLINAQNGERIWRTATGEAVSSIIYDKNTKTIISLGSSGLVHSLSSSDGKILWWDNIGGKPLSEMSISKNRIFIQSGQGNLYVYGL